MLPLRHNVDLCDPNEQCYGSVDSSPDAPNKKRKSSSEVKNGSRVYPHPKRQRSDISTEDDQTVVQLLMAEQDKRAFSKYGNHFHELSPMALANSSTKPGQTKKIVIKNFKDKPNLPDNFQEATWMKLKESVQAIHKKTSIGYSLEELYKAVENMCSHKMASLLYDQLKEECERHVYSSLSQFTGYPLI